MAGGKHRFGPLQDQREAQQYDSFRKVGLEGKGFPTTCSSSFHGHYDLLSQGCHSQGPGPHCWSSEHLSTPRGLIDSWPQNWGSGCLFSLTWPLLLKWWVGGWRTLSRWWVVLPGVGVSGQAAPGPQCLPGHWLTKWKDWGRLSKGNHNIRKSVKLVTMSLEGTAKFFL